MKQLSKIIFNVLKSWLNENSFSQSAAAAYYAVFSLPGLIIVMSVMASLFYEKTLVDNEINTMIEGFIGQELSLNLKSTMEELSLTKSSWMTLAIGAGTILFGATRFFMQLQRSLNFIWDVEIKKSSTFILVIKKRLMSLALVLFVGFMLLVTLSVTSVMAILADYIAIKIPYINIDTMVIVNRAVMFSIVVLLFTLIFKIVPDAIILWSSSAIGAVVSALFFTLGQTAITTYFSITDPQSAFGAAGSITLMMLWVSYAFMILLLGAHTTRAHMEWATGKKAKPESDIAKKSIPSEKA
jgi:membrane protein